MQLVLTGPIGDARRAADRENEPQWLTLIAHAGILKWPRAASRCLVPAAILIQPSRSGAASRRGPQDGSSKRSPRGPGTDVEGGN